MFYFLLSLFFLLFVFVFVSVPVGSDLIVLAGPSSLFFSFRLTLHCMGCTI